MCYSQTVSVPHVNVWIQNSGNIKCCPRLFTVSLSFQLPWVGRKCLTSTFFQNNFLAVPVYPVMLTKKSISFEWCKSGVLLVPFVVSANKLTWQFTVPNTDRWYSHWTQVLKKQIIFSEPQYKTAHIISPSHPWTSTSISCSAHEYPPAKAILANLGKINSSYGTYWKKGLQDLLHREWNGKSPGGPDFHSQFTVANKDYPMGLSQGDGEIFWGYKSILKHRVKENCGAEQREETCTPPHTEDMKRDVTSHLSTPWVVPGRQNPSLGSPGASCCWNKSLES